MPQQDNHSDSSAVPATGLTRRQFMGVAGAGLAGTVLAATAGCAASAGGAQAGGTAKSPATQPDAQVEAAPPYEGPIFDAHLHYSQAYLDEILASYAEGGIMGGCNLWNGNRRFKSNYHGSYEEMLRLAKQKKMDKFVQFYWPEWEDYLTEGPKFIERHCRDMRRFADLGCKGMKVWKDFGMYFMRADGTPVTIDDPGLNPVWKTAAEIGWTITLHQADPTSNWTPGKKYFPATTLKREDIYRCRDKVIEAHPEIRFVLCHAGNNIESLPRFGEYLDRHPHVNSDLATSWENWGTPQETYAFLTKYVDRLYHATDIRMPEDRAPDRDWNNRAWSGQRAKLGRWQKHAGREVVQKLAWGNGIRDYVGGAV